MGGNRVRPHSSVSSAGSRRFALDLNLDSLSRVFLLAPAPALCLALALSIGSATPWIGAAGFGQPTPIAFRLLLVGAFVGSFVLVGVCASGRAERDFGRKDGARILIVELVGRFIALVPLLVLLRADSTFFSVIVGVVTAFVLFRLFDIWKPGAVEWAE